jgi:hypothetical protein
MDRPFTVIVPLGICLISFPLSERHEMVSTMHMAIPYSSTTGCNSAMTSAASSDGILRCPISLRYSQGKAARYYFGLAQILCPDFAGSYDESDNHSTGLARLNVSAASIP